MNNVTLLPFDNHDDFDPCPFCGGTDIHHESQRGMRMARCQTCSAGAGFVFDFEEAPFTRETVVKRWNTRVSERLQDGR